MKKKEAVKTILVLVLACIVGYAVFRSPWFLAAAALLALSCFAGERIPVFIARSWQRFGLVLGAINTKVLLCVVFYGFLTPLAWLYRRFNKKDVSHFTQRREGTYFKDVNRPCTGEVFKKLW